MLGTPSLLLKTGVRGVQVRVTLQKSNICEISSLNSALCSLTEAKEFIETKFDQGGHN